MLLRSTSKAAVTAGTREADFVRSHRPCGASECQTTIGNAIVLTRLGFRGASLSLVRYYLDVHEPVIIARNMAAITVRSTTTLTMTC